MQGASGTSTVVGVDLRDEGPAVRQFGNQWAVTYPLLLDQDGTVTESYRVNNLPATFFLDRGGVIRHIVLGAINASRLQEGLALAGR
ncbi:MAG: hypothetical protein NVS2B7_02430 [Herpetosiphon sp.]